MKQELPKNYKVSVCLATYNGDKYIYEQAKSILAQLSDDDELIIVDDCSTDDTVLKIKAINDKKIHLYVNKTNLGVNATFERAIKLAKNDYIFLSDQDDIWIEDRVHTMVSKLCIDKSALITSNLTWIDDENAPVDIKIDGVSSQKSNSYFKNILDIFYGKTNYYGCAMMFRKELRQLICPMPKYVESHDLWIAFAGNLLKSNTHIDDVMLLKRIHDNNLTSTVSKRPFYKKLFSRVIFVLSLLTLTWRLILKQAKIN